MEPAIELYELGVESLICESPTVKDGNADPDFPVEIKGVTDVTEESILGLPDALKLF